MLLIVDTFAYLNTDLHLLLQKRPNPRLCLSLFSLIATHNQKSWKEVKFLYRRPFVCICIWPLICILINIAYRLLPKMADSYSLTFISLIKIFQLLTLIRKNGKNELFMLNATHLHI